MTLKETEGLR